MTNQVHFSLFPPSLLDYWYWGWAVPHYAKCRNASFPLSIIVVDITVLFCFISFQLIAFYNSVTWWKFMIIIVIQQRLNFKEILQQLQQIVRVVIFSFNHSNVTFFNQFGNLSFVESAFSNSLTSSLLQSTYSICGCTRFLALTENVLIHLYHLRNFFELVDSLT